MSEFKYTYIMSENNDYIILENGEPLNPQVVATRLNELEDQKEILKMIVMNTPEAVNLVRVILSELDNKDYQTSSVASNDDPESEETQE